MYLSPNIARRLAFPKILSPDERGLSTVEYVIILVLIAVSAIGIWNTFGKTIIDKVTTSNDQMMNMENATSGKTQ